MAARYGTDKEVAAVTCNLKQQRLMEKNLQTLSLEESYAVKLLEINRRIVQVNYGRMTDKVAQINSFLTPEEIKILNEMEATGNFKSMYSAPNFSPSLRISSAEKRLKLNSTPRPNTAVPYETHRDEVHSSRREKRPHTGHRMHADEYQSDNEDSSPRHHSSKGRHSRPKTAHMSSATPSGDAEENNGHPRLGKSRPVTSTHRGTSDQGTTATQRRDRAKTAPSSSKPTLQHNCHDAAAVGGGEVRSLTSAMGGTPRSRSTAELTRVSSEGNKGGGNFQERKMEMLKMEAQRGLELDSKKNNFLKKVCENVKSNPSHIARRVSIKATPVDPELVRPAEGSPAPSARRLRRKHTAEFGKISEEDYKQRVEDSWKDLSKCRYLRIPGKEDDSSTDNTLVKDKMQLMQIFKQKRSKSFMRGFSNP